jgi:hypothetical protein
MEASYREAEALKRQDQLIAEEFEAASMEEQRKGAQVTAAPRACMHARGLPGVSPPFVFPGEGFPDSSGSPEISGNSFFFVFLLCRFFPHRFFALRTPFISFPDREVNP